MTIEELKKRNGIYFENIQEGFEQYENAVVTQDATQAYHNFFNMWMERGRKDVYVDFYYFVIPSEAREKIDSILSKEEKNYLAQLKQEKGQIIFPIEEMLLNIVTKLNEKEMLFSTIYVTGEIPSTWWGNYEKQYVVFQNQK